MAHSDQQAPNFNVILMAGQGKEHTYVTGMSSELALGQEGRGSH